MKNITAQYRDLLEGKMSQANFMTNVRRQFPDYISVSNNFKDAVSILKSKRILNENDFPEMDGDKTFYLIDHGTVVDSIKASDQRAAENHFANEYEGMMSGWMVSDVHPDSLDEAVDTELEDAKEEARRESENGYVQHVNKSSHGYSISDWYDADSTVASYENGEQINETKASSDEEEYDKEEAEEAERVNMMIDQELEDRNALNEAVEKSEGSYKKVTGKDLYSTFSELDRLNPYEVRKGITIELGMQNLATPNTFTTHFNPDTVAKATKKVIKNLMKDPAFYTNQLSEPTEKRVNMPQKPKEVKTQSDGHIKIKGFTDAKSNTETNLAKKEKGTKAPEGVKTMKPTKKSMGGIKVMKSNEKLPKGVELMKENSVSSGDFKWKNDLNVLWDKMTPDQRKELLGHESLKFLKLPSDLNTKPWAGIKDDLSPNKPILAKLASLPKEYVDGIVGGKEDKMAKLKETLKAHLTKAIKETMLTNPTTKKSVTTTSVAGDMLAKKKGFTQIEPGGKDVSAAS